MGPTSLDVADDPAPSAEYRELERHLDSLERVARRRLESVNRKSWQPGYSLEVRKAAAYKTLVEQGFPPGEARLTVEAMVDQGLLPDPPRR